MKSLCSADNGNGIAAAAKEPNEFNPGMSYYYKKSRKFFRRESLTLFQDTILEVKNLSIIFETDEERKCAVDDISFSLRKEETLGIVGESGSGKSTTALGIVKLIPAPPGRIQHGEIWLHGKGGKVNLAGASESVMRSIRGGRIAMIFQEPMTFLNPVFRCGDQVMEAIVEHEPMSALMAGQRAVELFQEVSLPNPAEFVFRYPHQLSGGQRQRVSRVLEPSERVGLPTSYLSRYPHEFSGGERQRIAIARALVLQPKLLICDEAVSALDVSVQARILNLLNRLKTEMRLTYIFISHDLALVKFMSERIAVIKEGRIVEIGPAEEVFRNPQSPYTRELTAAVLKGTLEDVEQQQARRGRLSKAR